MRGARVSDGESELDLHADDIVALYAYVLLEPPTPGWVAGAGADVLVIERESESGHDEVQLASSQGGVDFSGALPRATGPVNELVADAFGFSPESRGQEVLAASRGGVDSLLVNYAGFDDDDIDLRWPSEMDQ